jgi:hypothetical protein
MISFWGDFPAKSLHILTLTSSPSQTFSKIFTLRVQFLNWLNFFEMNFFVTRSRITENWKLNVFDIDKTGHTLGQHVFTELRMRTVGSGEFPLVWSPFLYHTSDMRVIKPMVSKRTFCFDTGNLPFRGTRYNHFCANLTKCYKKFDKNKYSHTRL